MNKQELITGFVFGICFWPVIGIWCVLLALVAGFLWALSGMQGQSKLWRRLGVPFITAIAILATKHNWSILLSIPIVWGILSIGYGIPQKKGLPSE